MNTIGSLRYTITAFAALVLFSACASVPVRFSSTDMYNIEEKARHAQPLFTYREEAAAEYRTEYKRGILTSPMLPGVEIIGDMVSLDAETFYVNEVHITASWVHGWTEAHYDASGTIEFALEGSEWKTYVRDTIALWTLTHGEIRYFDTYIVGDEALSTVRGRIDRAQALAAWLRTEHGVFHIGHWRKSTEYGEPVDVVIYNAVEAADGQLPEWLVRLQENNSLERDIQEAGKMIMTFVNLDYFQTRIDAGNTVEESQK